MLIMVMGNLSKLTDIRNILVTVVNAYVHTRNDLLWHIVL